MKVKKRGITLIEIVISMAILSIILIPILSLLLTASKETKMGDEKVAATNKAQEIIENIKSDDLEIQEGKYIDLKGFGIEASEGDKEEFFTEEDCKKPTNMVYKIKDNDKENVYENMYVKIGYDPPITKGLDEKYSYNMFIDKGCTPSLKESTSPFKKVPGKDVTKIKDIKIIIENSEVIEEKGEHSVITIKILDNGSKEKNKDSNIENEDKIYEDFQIKFSSNISIVKFNICFIGSDDKNYQVEGVNNSGDKFYLDLTGEKLSTGNYNIIQKNNVISKIAMDMSIEKYSINLEIWKYDKGKGEKILLQKIKSYKYKNNN